MRRISTPLRPWRGRCGGQADVMVIALSDPSSGQEGRDELRRAWERASARGAAALSREWRVEEAKRAPEVRTQKMALSKAQTEVRARLKLLSEHENLLQQSHAQVGAKCAELEQLHQHRIVWRLASSRWAHPSKLVLR